jgi:hypothetical protein
MIAAKDRFRFLGRLLVVERVEGGVVEYVECYPDGSVFFRFGSTIQFECDIDAGDMAAERT